MVVVYFILLFIDQMKLEAGKIDTLNRPKILLDAVVMMLNIAGQVLLSLAFMEQWYIWNLVNVASISLWVVTLTGSGASGYAVVMLIKYVFYLLNSINGLRIWLGLSREK
jgi:nicotinamide mononucleotide transporter